jgi:hypothetical protein
MNSIGRRFSTSVPSHLLYIGLLAAILLSPACHRDTEEDRVRKVITEIQQSAEEKKILAVLDHISMSYRDPQGYDRDGIKGLLAFYFFRHRKVSVYMPNVDIVVTGLTAKATFQAILTGRGTGESAGTILPEALGAYNFEVLFRKEDGRWKVTSAKWERAGEGQPQ